MKIQFLTSKKSWLTKEKKFFIISSLKKFSKDPKFITDYKKLNKNYDITIIISYYKIIKSNYLLFSKHNLVAHESDLPSGRGHSPLYWQILKSKKKIVTTLFECSKRMDSGPYYYKKKFNYAEDLLYDEIKEQQFLNSFELVIKFLNYYNKNKKAPSSKKQNGKASYFKKLNKKDSEINIHKSLKSQFNRLRTTDNDNFPAFFFYKKRKFILKIFSKK
jgi:methionyl-tRNA formyltransferase